VYNHGKIQALRVLGFIKGAEEFGAHVGQLILPGIGTALGAYGGDAKDDDTRMRRALTSGAGGAGGFMLPGVALSMLGMDPTLVHLAARAGGHLGAHLGYQHGNAPQA
jgi:hypothetical protein